MTTRPTAEWRAKHHAERAGLAAGTLQAEKAYAIHLWLTEFTDDVDAALEKFQHAAWAEPIVDEADGPS